MLLEAIPERRTSPIPVAISVAVHVLALAALLYRLEPAFIKAQPSLHGNGGRGHLMALVTPGVSALRAPKALAEEEPQRLTAPPKRSRKSKAAENVRPTATTADKDLKPGMPGFILGSLSDGFASNHDVRAAVSIVAPDPPIVRSRLPEWIRGDVIVEVTIDERGNVIATRVLQTVGFGLDQVIIETLRRWRYIPARVDGVAVASREDVHFHFPS